MTAQIVQLTSPPIGFYMTIADSLAKNQVLFLENLVPPSIKLPDVCYIRRVEIWNQMGGDYPAGASGDISFAVDPGRQYERASGFPLTQNALPQYLKTLGVLEFLPGRQHFYDEDLELPIAYVPYRDGIIVAPEAFSYYPYPLAEIYLGLSFEAECDIAAPAAENPPAGATDVYRGTLDHGNYALQNYCLRNRLPPVEAAGSQFRAQVTAPPYGPCVINHASVGIQSGAGSSTTAVPTELKFGGASGVSLAANEARWSDWTAFGTSVGQVPLVTLSLFGANTNWGYKNVNADGNWNSQTDSWNTAALQGTVTYQATRSHIIERAQTQ